MTDRIDALRALENMPLNFILNELTQAVGDNAVRILLRHEPNAGRLRQQLHRQAYTAPIRALIAQEDKP